jgi:hypothetical protein
VSIGRAGEEWAVYHDRHLIVDGYQTPSEAWWAVSYLARGKPPAYVPHGAELNWPSRDRQRRDHSPTA